MVARVGASVSCYLSYSMAMPRLTRRLGGRWKNLSCPRAKQTQREPRTTKEEAAERVHQSESEGKLCA